MLAVFVISFSTFLTDGVQAGNGEEIRKLQYLYESYDDGTSKCDWVNEIDITPKDWNGEVVVLAGGYPPMMLLSSPFLQSFTDAGYRVLSVDTNRADYRWRMFKGVEKQKAEILLDFLDEKGITKVDYLIVYSEGALYGTIACNNQLQKFDNLILLDVAGLVNLDKDEYSKRILSIMFMHLINPETKPKTLLILADYLDLAFKYPLRHIGITRAILYTDIFGTLADLQGEGIDIKFYHGESDMLFTVAEVQARFSEHGIAPEVLQIIPDEGHFGLVFNGTKVGDIIVNDFPSPYSQRLISPIYRILAPEAH